MKDVIVKQEGRNMRPSICFLKKLRPYLILLGVLILYYLFYTFTPFSIPCVFRKVTSLFFEDGLLCPGCGVTRMLAAEIRLDFATAFLENQAVFILQPFIYFEIAKLIYCDFTNNKVKYTKIESVLLILAITALIIFGIWRNLIVRLT